MAVIATLCLPAIMLAAGDLAPAPAATLPATSVVLLQQDVAEDLNAKALRELEEARKAAEAARSQPAPASVPEPVSGVETYDEPSYVEPEWSGGVAAPVTGVALANVSDQEIYQRAARYLEGVQTLSARFRQTSMTGALIFGTLQMERPGKVRFEYDEPMPNVVVANGGNVYVYDADLETTDSYPLNRTPLKFLLNERIQTEGATLRRVFRQPGKVSITLESMESETPGQLVLDFRAPDMVLDGWAVIDARGNVTTIELENVVEGTNIPNTAFRIPEAGGFGLRDR